MRIPKPCLSVRTLRKENHPGFFNISFTLVIDTSMGRSSRVATQKVWFFFFKKSAIEFWLMGSNKNFAYIPIHSNVIFFHTSSQSFIIWVNYCFSLFLGLFWHVSTPNINSTTLQSMRLHCYWFCCLNCHSFILFAFLVLTNIEIILCICYWFLNTWKLFCCKG